MSSHISTVPLSAGILASQIGVDALIIGSGGISQVRRFQISTNGGEEPKWSPKGNELFYRNGQKWMKVDIGLGSSVTVGKPENLFEGPFVNVPGYSYDVGPGAQKFMVLLEAGAGSSSEVRIVLNWFNELRARLDKTQ